MLIRCVDCKHFIPENPPHYGRCKINPNLLIENPLQTIECPKAVPRKPILTPRVIK